MLGVLDSLRSGFAPLRVAVDVTDPVRQAALAAMVAAAGHDVVPFSQAELALVDRPTDTSLPQLLFASEAEPGSAPSMLPPGAGVRQIDAALRAVAAGLVVYAPGQPPDAGLTPREMEVLACLGDGSSNKTIARQLGISQHTVKFHVEAIFTKLQVTSRSEAVAKSMRRGLIGL